MFLLPSYRLFQWGNQEKAEDLCGCNDELIRPLNEVTSVPTMKFNVQRNRTKDVGTHARNQVEAKASNQEGSSFGEKDTSAIKPHSI